MSTEDAIELVMSEVFSIRSVYICIYTLERKVSEVHVILAGKQMQLLKLHPPPPPSQIRPHSSVFGLGSVVIALSLPTLLERLHLYINFPVSGLSK